MTIIHEWTIIRGAQACRISLIFMPWRPMIVPMSSLGTLRCLVIWRPWDRAPDWYPPLIIATNKHIHYNSNHVVFKEMSTQSNIYHQFVYWGQFVRSLGDGLLVTVLASINEVNLHWIRLVLRWVTVSGFSSRCRTFISVCNQPPKANSAFHPSRVGKWVPASAGKAKAGMVHSVSGWMGVCGVCR